MISISGGIPGTDEYKASQKLERLILDSWPDIATSEDDHVRIVSDVNCYGQNPRELDIVVFVFLKHSRAIIEPISKTAIHIHNFALVVEYKRLGLHCLTFEGDQHVYVKYQNEGYYVDKKSERQKYSLKNYLEAHNIRAPFIFNFVWFDSIYSREIITKNPIILGNDITWDVVLQKIALLAPKKHETLGFGSNQTLEQTKKAIDHLTKKMRATHLELRRIDEVTKSTVAIEKYISYVGNSFLSFRGRGGSGKTAALLHLAYQRYKDYGDRVLFLSYNHALISDIRRLLSLMQIQNEFLVDGLRISTVYRFIGSLTRSLGVSNSPSLTIDQYSEYNSSVKQVVELVRGGAIAQDDMDSLRKNNPDDFDWDFVIIDEAQDWPEEERDLLIFAYGHKRLVIADGVDQLVRSNKATNWRKPIPRREAEIITLKRSLRLKYNLALFVERLARYMELDWDLAPNEGLHGGRVIIVEGSYVRDQGLHDKMIRDLKSEGHQPVNMLFCVPPDPNRKRSHKFDRRSCIGEWLEENKYQIWDGTIRSVRDMGFPIDNEQFRIVQYDSSRGVEGWTVVLLGFDEFASYKNKFYTKHYATDAEDDTERHLEFISRWLMIPLTRAIDTLVIEVSSLDHPVSRALRAVADECPDFVEWRSGTTAD